MRKCEVVCVTMGARWQRLRVERHRRRADSKRQSRGGDEQELYCATHDDHPLRMRRPDACLHVWLLGAMGRFADDNDFMGDPSKIGAIIVHSRFMFSSTIAHSRRLVTFVRAKSELARKETSQSRIRPYVLNRVTVLAALLHFLSAHTVRRFASPLNPNVCKGAAESCAGHGRRCKIAWGQLTKRFEVSCQTAQSCWPLSGLWAPP